MRVLIITPIPSHPENQGNSARITSIGKQLQSLGHVVHFLYYPLEGLSADQKREMESCWDYFHSIKCDLPNTAPTLGKFFAIDDWHDPKLGEMAKDLHEKWNFGAVLVNYVWFSAVLESIPDNVLKIIDTHDVFGDRHLRFEEVGLEPEWFFTTQAEERKGLERAHLAFAIQDSEAAYFDKLLEGSRTKVTTIGFLIPPRFVPTRKIQKRIKVGYLGSGNPFNVNSLQKFIAMVGANKKLAESFEFHIAGTVCEKLGALTEPFVSIGRIDRLEDFYTAVDIVINPMVGGTGLKIKTLEALSFGIPFLGTTDAMAGINPTHPFQALPDVSELLDKLGSIIKARDESLKALRDSARQCYKNYVRQHQTLGKWVQ